MRQPIEWKEVFVNHISDKVSIFNIYEKLIYNSIAKTNN